MRRSWTYIAALALLVGACSGATPTASPTVGSPSSAPPTTASAAPTPAPTIVTIAANVTFDGKACVYAGPKVIPLDAELTLTMTNLPAALQGSIGASLLVMPIRQGTTWEQVVADTAAATSVSNEPDWIFLPNIGDAAVKILYPESPSHTLRVVPSFELDYLVMCATSPNETDKGFPATLLNVMRG